MSQRRGGIEITVLCIDDQWQISRHEIAHFQQQLQAKWPQRLVEAKARFDRTHVRTRGLHHGFDPVPGLTQKRAIAHAVAQGPALQHLGVWIETRHQ